jgi:hypothetical protein
VWRQGEDKADNNLLCFLKEFQEKKKKAQASVPAL